MRVSSEEEPHNVFTHFLEGSKGKFESSQRLPELRAIIHDSFGDEENESRLQHRYADRGTRTFALIDSKRPNEEQSCARDDDKFVKNRAARSETRYYFYRLFPRIYTCCDESAP